MADDMTKLTSVRELAAFIGRSRGTVATWLTHTDWPYSRHAPWNVADAAAMLAWSSNLRGGGRRAERDRADDGFWTPDRTDWPPLAVADDDGRPLPADRLPGEVVADWERATIAAGAGHLTPAGVAALVADAVAMRARLADLARWLAPWLVGHDRTETERRLRTAIVDHLTLNTAMAEWIGANHRPPTGHTGRPAARAAADERKPTRRRNAGRTPAGGKR